MTRLARLVLRHRRLVVLCWVVLAGLGGATASLTTSRLGKTFALPGSASWRADGAVVARYGVDGDPAVAVVTTPPGERVTSRSSSAVLARAERAATLGGRYRVVGWPEAGTRRLVTDDGRRAALLVFEPPAGFGTKDPTSEIVAAARDALPSGWSLSPTGVAALTAAGGERGNGVLVESVIGGAGGLVILAVVFASALAILPLVIALAAIPTTFLVLLGVTELVSINFVVQFLIGLIGLGVAIDYSLLVVTRWREESARHPGEEAVVVAMETAGRSVVVSGTTVAVGLLSLVVLPVPFLHSMGIGGVLIPLVSVAAALTLLPVCLATFGPRLDRHRLRGRDSASRPWMWWAALVARRRVAAAAVGLAIVVALLLPLGRLAIGQQRSSSLSAGGPARAALATLRRGGVPTGVLDPMQVLVGGPDAVTHADAVARRLGALPGIWTAIGPEGAADARDGTALVTVVPAAETGAPGGTVAVADVRAAVAGDPWVLAVSGSGPESVDLDHAIYGRFPLLLVLVSLLSLLVLIRAFRSLLLALKAVLLNLVSLGCAYGVLVLVWQEGHGSRLLFGLPATGVLVDWVPIVVFAFLFGLAIDYEVFILTRMRERYDETADTEAAVVDGIGRTGRLVTSAALILTLAFVSMATAPFAFLKVLATGLAAGILVDAFVVRCLLVPALVCLLGPYNWWLPAGLARILRVEPSLLRSPARPPGERGRAQRLRSRVVSTWNGRSSTGTLPAGSARSSPRGRSSRSVIEAVTSGNAVASVPAALPPSDS